MPLLTKSSFTKNFSGYLLVLLFIGISLSSQAQKDCSKTLQEARNLYDLGMIDEIPKMLASCMQEGFTRTQKIEAYKLLILAYLFDDNQFDAERTMTEFLKKYPEYEIMPNDPVEFIHLFESYRTTSEFSFGLIAGINLTNPRIIKPYSMLDKHTTELSNASGTGYQAGIGAGRYLGKRLMLNMELHFAQHQYSFTDENTIPREDGTVYKEAYTFKEKLQKITFPVSVLYEINNGKLLYFLRAGASVNYILTISGTPSSTINKQPSTGESTDLKDYRNSLYYSAIAGMGLHYKIPRGFLAVDLQYNFGINNIVLPDKRFENTYALSQYKYQDDDFSLHTFTLSIGYYFSFYSPKKQK